ncbi:MAG: hypothetical protein IKS90_03390 [Clostridia bacterium]|nr:hypothetical protein [Clostridia bacterium]
MKKKIYYYLREERFDESTFIEKYADMYFESDESDESDENLPCPFPFLNKTTQDDENKILNLLEKDYKWTCEDVLNILVWKTGAKEYKYSDDEITLTPPGREETNITNLAKKIVEEQADLRKKASECCFAEAYKSILDIVVESEAKNIGTVYCITLLFFLSMGKIAIYDKQAHKSLLAIKNCVLPGKSVGYLTPPDKTAKKKVAEMYDEFYQMLIELFPDYPDCDIPCKRNIDRALWVYGHYFEV